MEGMRRHISYANVAATLALVLATSGGAVAATGGFSSGGTLRACANEEGAIRLIKAGKKCKKGQTAVAWNQTGPAGAPGAKGATGAAGAPGAAGAKGNDGAKGLAGDSTNIKWGVIGFNGQIRDANGVVGAAVAGGGNHYAVAFSQDITHCAITVTPVGEGDSITAEVERAGTEAMVYLRTGNATDETEFSIVADC